MGPFNKKIMNNRSIFNWESIIYYSLTEAIRAEKKPKPGKEPQFYISSYLMDMIYAANEFTRMEFETCCFYTSISIKTSN